MSRNYFASAAAVAKVTGLSYQIVLRHIKQGKLNAFRNNDTGKYMVDISDMEFYAYAAWEAGYSMYNPYETIHDRMRIYGLLEVL
jgi:predicted site-specific integrase-resolvase